MLDKIIKLLNNWIGFKKTGNITINFFKGGISSIDIRETKKVDELSS
jgi:hypothetical protein